MTSEPIILHNGTIRTLDQADTTVSAIEIRQGRIEALGRLDELPGAWDTRSRFLDLTGRCAIPGLTDGHAHMDREGLKDSYLSLEGVRSISELKDLLAAESEKLPSDVWLVTMPLGRGPDYSGDPSRHLIDERLPTRHDLDEVCPRRPVLIRAPWGYWRPASDNTPLVSVCNSAALEVSGLGDSFVAPNGVEFERDTFGRLTGVIREQGPVPVVETALLHRLSRISARMREQALDRSMDAYLGVGTTAIFEGHGVSPELLDLYRDADESGRLKIRARLVLGPSWGGEAPEDLAESLSSWYAWAKGRGLGNDWLNVAGLYAIAGGTERDRLLAAQRPYTGWAGYTYESSMPSDLFREFVLESARQGFRLATLFANSLNLFTEVDRYHPISHLRWVVGHIGQLTARQISQMRDLGMVATLHTNRSIADIGPHEIKRLGTERLNEIVPARALMDAGVPFAMSSDNHPVGLFGPIAHCVMRQHSSGVAVASEQALSRQEALKAAANGGAWLTFEEDVRGTLEVGKFADIVVLSDDPLNCEAHALPEIKSEVTIIDGRVVFYRGKTPISDTKPIILPQETPVYLTMSQARLDAVYDQRLWASNAEEIVRGYATDSKQARARLPVRRDIAYGDHDLELFDLYEVPQGEARACVIYVHGGAWKLLSKEESGYFAENMAALGVCVAALNFGKRPVATLRECIKRVEKAIAWIAQNGDQFGVPTNRLILCGHSSGAHLAAAAAGCDWQTVGLTGSPLLGALFASGAYDLIPVNLSARGDYLDLSARDVVELSPHARAHTITHPVTLAVGKAESPEFIRQTRAFHAALRAFGVPVRLIEASDLNHFEISTTLADPDGVLCQEVLRLINDVPTQ